MITLKPLTLFIGPNNSGKSYAAMLIHSIFESCAPFVPFSYLPPPLRRRFLVPDFDFRSVREMLAKELPTLTTRINSLKEGEEWEIPKPFLEKVINKIFDELYEEWLSGEIVRSYACPLNKLIRIGKKSFTLKINFNSYAVHLTSQKEKLKIEEYPKSDIKIKVKVAKEARWDLEVHGKEKEYLIQMGSDLREREKEFMFLRLADSISEICASILFKNMAMPCYYLPAARSE